MADKKKNIKMSPVEADKLKIIFKDPVLWAKAFVVSMNPETKKYGPWLARDYQAEILRNRDVRKVYRMGRRLGKCLPGWVKILDPETGELKSVEEIYESGLSASVVSMDHSHKLIKKRNYPVVCNGKKPVFKVTLKNGRTIDATDNHPLFTVNGWTEIKDLKTGDCIATPSVLPFFGNTKFDDNIVKLVAYAISDDEYENGNLSFIQNNDKQFAEARKIINDYGKDNVRKILKHFKIHEKTADNEIIPSDFFTLRKEQIAMFLSLLFSINGWIIHDDNSELESEIGYCSYSSELIYGISHLLLRFGIQTEIEQNQIWKLRIRDRHSILTFIRKIGILEKEKASLDVCSTTKMIEKAENEKDIEWQEIKSIEPIGSYTTYDLTVPDTHNFIANDIIVHNSECMVVDALWQVYVHKNYRVLFVTPYENQVELIFRRMREIIADSPLIKAEVARIKSSPYTVEFKNGSVILGFTTGAASGSGAASIRGQRADKQILLAA